MLQFLKIRHFCPTWTICTSNESWKHSTFKFDIKNRTCYKKICEKSVFQNFCPIFDQIFFSKLEFFKKFIIQPPIFMIATCLLLLDRGKNKAQNAFRNNSSRKLQMKWYHHLFILLTHVLYLYVFSQSSFISQHHKKEICNMCWL